MDLERTAREWYKPGVESTPTLTNWEASFDGGADWITGTIVDGTLAWLVQGPDFDPADFPAPGVTSTTIVATTHPQIRAVDNTEVVVRRPPAVRLMGPAPIPQPELLVTLPAVVTEMQGVAADAQAAAEAAIGAVAAAGTATDANVADKVVNGAATKAALKAAYASVVTATGVTATDTAAIQAAIDKGGRILIAPTAAGVSTPITVNPLIIKTGAHLDLGGCTIQLANGANADLVTVPNFGTLTGGGTAGGEHDFTIRNGILDGNRTNNTSGYGVRLYARRFTLAALDIINAAEDGLFTEWAFTGAGNDGMESHYNGLKIYGNGKWGWHNRGPHDSVAHQVIVYNNNASGGNFGGIWVENDNVNTPQRWLAGALQLTDSHIWGTSHKWAIIAEASTFISNTQIEGGSVGQVLALAPVIMRGGKVFNLTNNGRVPNIGIQLGDDGATPGYANTRAWNVGSCDINTRLQGFYGSTRVSAPIAWVGASKSAVNVDADMAINPVSTAIDAGAVGQQIGSIGSLVVADASSFPLAGQVTVPTSGGNPILAYTGITGNTLTGVSRVSGTATETISAGSATLVTAVVVGNFDRQSRISVRGTHGSATPTQRAAWSVETRAATDRWYGGASGAVKTMEIDAATGHITASGQAAALVVTPHANAGTGATASNSGLTDTRGQITITTGSASISAGTMVTVTLGSAFVDANPIVIAGPAGSSTAALNPYATSTGKGTFVIGFQTAPAASTSYFVNFFVVG